MREINPEHFLEHYSQDVSKDTSASRARHGAPKAIEPLRRTGDSMGTAVGAIPNTSLTWPYTLTLSGI